jgi:hypothetical protein
MLLKSVYDLIGAFGIAGANDPFAIGTVEKQHVTLPSPYSLAHGPISRRSRIAFVAMPKRLHACRVDPKPPLDMEQLAPISF